MQKADHIVVLGTSLGGATPANDATLTVIGSAGKCLKFNYINSIVTQLCTNFFSMFYLSAHLRIGGPLVCKRSDYRDPCEAATVQLFTRL